MGHLLMHWLGLDSASSPQYAFWSGIGSDISELALIGAVIGAYRKHNCHQPKCWRIGRHVVDGTPYCDRHHEAARNLGTGRPQHVCHEADIRHEDGAFLVVEFPPPVRPVPQQRRDHLAAYAGERVPASVISGAQGGEVPAAQRGLR